MIMPPPPAPLLLDTNVLIYHMRLALSDEVTQQLGDALKAKRAFVSAVIAATALAHDLQLMTGNESDFKRVAGLNLLCI